MILSIWDFIETRNKELENIDIDDEIDAFDIFESEEEEKDRSRRAIRRSKNRTKQKRMVRELGVNSIVPSDTDKRKMLAQMKKVVEFNSQIRRYNRRPEDKDGIHRYMYGAYDVDVDSEDTIEEEQEVVPFFTEWNVLVAVAHLRDEVYGDEVRSITTTEHHQWWEVTKSLLNMISEHSLKIWSEDGKVVFTAIKPLNGDMARLLSEIIGVFEMWS